MNTSMHDSWNLGWKLNLAMRGLAKNNILLPTYEMERKKIAHDLIDFDYEHANSIAGGDAQALAENFRTNIGFISGVGAEYGENILNIPNFDHCRLGLQNGHTSKGEARPGRNLPPAKVTRYIDDNPVDIQLDIPILGQFRVFILADVVNASAFLQTFSDQVLSPSSIVSQLSVAANQSYKQKPRPSRAKDAFYRPERYIPWSNLFTFGLISERPDPTFCLIGWTFQVHSTEISLTLFTAPTAKNNFELAALPPLLAKSKWTVYLDNIAAQDTRGQHCVQKWIGSLAANSIALVNVRPDGYVGSMKRFDITGKQAASEAAQWLDDYYSGFLQVTKD